MFISASKNGSSGRKTPAFNSAINHGSILICCKNTNKDYFCVHFMLFLDEKIYLVGYNTTFGMPDLC